MSCCRRQSIKLTSAQHIATKMHMTLDAKRRFRWITLRPTTNRFFHPYFPGILAGLGVLMTTLAAANLQTAEGNTNAPPASPGTNSQGSALEAKPTDKKATKEVDIRTECKVLEDVFRRRTMLHYLKSVEKEAKEAIFKSLDPRSSAAIKEIVEKEKNSIELDYHFVEKIKNCEQRILGKLRTDKFQGISDLLEAVSKKTHPISAGFANLMTTVDLNLRYALRRGVVEMDDAFKETVRKLTAETHRVQGTAGFSMAELAKAVWKETKPDDFPAQWLDPSSEIISFEFGPVPESKEFPLVNLAAASQEDLLKVPEVEIEIAEAILAYRKKNGLQGAEELRLIDKIPAHLLEPLQSLCTASRGTAPPPKKSWTVMVYLNAANNLEPFGIEDMNEMETVGSDANVNIVVECARFRGKATQRPNPAYLNNPFTEFGGTFYWGLDNSPGTHRYYILKDDDKVRIRSVLLGNVGETDAGRPEPLAEFGKWAVDNFPADHYALVIWNHGAGWSGVSYDDNTHHGMDMPDVRQACEKICEALKKQNKEKIDVLDFDACLMATLEVAFELKDTVDYLAASQEVEPGEGMQYADYLKWLATYPEASAPSLAKAMVETYVKSYAPGGSQTSKDFWAGGETKSAIRCSQAPALKNAVEDVAKLLLAKSDLLGDLADQIVRDSRRFGRLVDIHDFFQKVADHYKNDQPLKEAVAKVKELIGYPEEGKDNLINEVLISRRTPGSVIWGFNGWSAPPRNLAPFVSNARFARTPLCGPDDKSNYVARIKFPPMLQNSKTEKLEFVKEINYRFDDDSDKRSVTNFLNTTFTASFPASAMVAAEGHNVGGNRSHGLSLYFPAYLGYDPNYRRLRFAEGSSWAALCEKFPLKRLEKPESIALLGLNHLTLADREKLGAVTIAEELEKAMNRFDCSSRFTNDLAILKRKADAIKDPRIYGEDWAETLAHYLKGVVILDNTTGGEAGGGLGRFPMGGVGPESRDILRHLGAGGCVLLGTGAATRATWDLPLYRDTLGLEYVRTWNRGYAFNLAGAKEAKKEVYEIETARKGDSLTLVAARPNVTGVTPFAILPDGQWIGAKIDRQHPLTGKAFRAIVLGFYLADIKGDEARRTVIKEALAFLEGDTFASSGPAKAAGE